jgi:hypothetical protein
MVQPFWAAKQQLHTPGSCLVPVELQVMYSKSRQYMGQNLARHAHASVVWMEQPMTMSPAIFGKKNGDEAIHEGDRESVGERGEGYRDSYHTE